MKTPTRTAPNPYSCDTSVVLPPLTADGSVIFAKNSDRSPNECQPLRHFPRVTHAPNSTLKTQYLTIPQVETTWEMILSAPYWLWGAEMGVNEWGVTIGNEAVQTREPTHERALIGMDLVRLGLERAETADAAVQIIGDLIEQYGQGGSCEAAQYRTYQNSFIIADASGAWILETAGHRWAASRVQERGAISNLLTIDEWDLASPILREHAEDQGWWQATGGFAAAYQDPETDLTTRICRLERAREILGTYQTVIGFEDMMAVLRDHGDRDLPTGPEPLPTICMHANPAFPGETAAGMVVQIRPDAPELLRTTIWTAYGSPCLSIFRPVYPFAVGLPESVSIGSAAPSDDSPWWLFERLQRIVARSPDLAATVRTSFARIEQGFINQAKLAEAGAMSAIAAGREDEAIAYLGGLVQSTTREAIAAARQMIATLESNPSTPIPELAEFWDALETSAKPA